MINALRADKKAYAQAFINLSAEGNLSIYRFITEGFIAEGIYHFIVRSTFIA